MDWDKLRVFYHVARAESFLKASEKMNLTQPSLSRNIQILEESLKITLFNRHPKGVCLTRQGSILFDTVEKIFSDLEATTALMLEEAAQPKGSLKVASTVALASLWLVEYIPAFLELYPEIELDIIGDDEQLDMRTRETDVSIRPSIGDNPDLIQEYLFSCCLKLYASPEYIKKHGMPSSEKQLDDHQIITFGESTIRPYSNIDWALKLGLASGKVRKPFVSINSSQGALTLAEKGLGIISLSDEFPGIERLNLVPVLPDVKGPKIDIFYVYPKTLKDYKKVKVFGDFLKEKLNSEINKNN